jgi:hypothetical protein
MRIAPRCIVIVALVVTLAACRQQGRENTAAARAKFEAEDRAYQQELSRDEQQFVATLNRTKALAHRGVTLALYEVANPFDSNYEALSSRDQVSRYPIVRTIHLPKQITAELIAKLTDRSSYFPPGQTWTCLFEPHHVLVFGTGSERITAVVCVKCGDVDFIVGDRSIGVHSLTPAANRALIELLEGG